MAWSVAPPLHPPPLPLSPTQTLSPFTLANTGKRSRRENGGKRGLLGGGKETKERALKIERGRRRRMERTRKRFLALWGKRRRTHKMVFFHLLLSWHEGEQVPLA